MRADVGRASGQTAAAERWTGDASSPSAAQTRGRAYLSSAGQCRRPCSASLCVAQAANAQCAAAVCLSAVAELATSCDPQRCELHCPRRPATTATAQGNTAPPQTAAHCHMSHVNTAALHLSARYHLPLHSSYLRSTRRCAISCCANSLLRHLSPLPTPPAVIVPLQLPYRPVLPLARDDHVTPPPPSLTSPTPASSGFAMPSSAPGPGLPPSFPAQPFPPSSYSLFLPPPLPPASPPSFPPSSASSLPFPAAYAPSMCDDGSSFTLTLLSPHHPALLKLSSSSFAPLRQWLPWLEWDGHWQESYPMQTTARCPVNRLSDTIHVLQQHGFKQTRVSCPHSQHCARPVRFRRAARTHQLRLSLSLCYGGCSTCSWRGSEPACQRLAAVYSRLYARPCMGSALSTGQNRRSASFHLRCPHLRRIHASVCSVSGRVVSADVLVLQRCVAEE